MCSAAAAGSGSALSLTNTRLVSQLSSWHRGVTCAAGHLQYRECSLTRRSSGRTTALRSGRQALGLRPILRLPSSPQCRCTPLSSNVRLHKFQHLHRATDQSPHTTQMQFTGLGQRLESSGNRTACTAATNRRPMDHSASRLAVVEAVNGVIKVSSWCRRRRCNVPKSRIRQRRRGLAQLHGSPTCALFPSSIHGIVAPHAMPLIVSTASAA